MHAEILATGDEIRTGALVGFTNSAWIAQASSSRPGLPWRVSTGSGTISST
ncbi:MAG: hypothetical protein MZV70_51675 [Desulfobacterales bacterium]|nr:hypothetical protein [Desulfobacterales bacterium]